MRVFKVIRVLVFIALGLVGLYAALGFIGVPWAVKKYGIPEVSKLLDRPVILRDLAFDPFAFNLKLEGFEIQDADGTPMVGFEQLFVNFEATSVLADAYRFDIIRLSLPFGLVKILKDGRLNLAELGKGMESPEAETPADDSSGSKPFLVDIGLLSIEQGAVEFRDESKPTPFVADIVPVQITLRNFSTRPGNQNSYFVSAELGEGERLQWQGNVSLEPLRSQGQLEIAGLRAGTMWQYVQDLFAFEISQGLLDLQVAYNVDAAKDPMGVMLDKGTITLRNFALREKGRSEDLIVVPSFSIRDIEANVGTRKVSVGSIQSRGTEVRGWINQDGTVNYQTLFAGRSASTNSEEVEVSQEPGSNAEEPPWSATIKKISLEEYAVRFEDRQPATPVPLHVEGLELHVQNVSTDLSKPVPLELGFTLNQSGKLAVQGQVTPEPLASDLKLDLSGLAFLPFQSYLEPFVQFQLERGVLAVNGHTSLSSEPGKDPVVRFSGDVTIDDFALIDTEATEEFLRWDQLAFQGIAVESQPMRVDLRELAITLPYAKVVQGEKGTLNLARLFSAPGDQSQESDGKDFATADESETDEEFPNEAEGDPNPVPLLTIDTVQITNAAVDFTDQAVDPHVVTGIQNFTGTIQGLSSKELSKADVSLEGQVDDVATLKIQGQINPLQDDLYTDLTLLFKNLDLTTASPYAGRYIGYPIAKGKLSLDLEYSLSEKILIGENKVHIDQLTLGDATDSPDAPSLPVPLALALLKDREGRIDIDLPVRGDLNNPEFSYGELVLQTLVNLITKAATSPFAMIGGLLEGSGDDLAVVTFSRGQTELSNREIEKLSTLATALSERPGLRLEITGGAQRALDGTRIAEVKLDDQLQQLQQQESSLPDQMNPTPTEETGSSNDQDRLVKKLYVKKFGQVFTNEPGPAGIASASSTESPKEDIDVLEKGPAQSKPPSLGEMRQRLLESIQITEDELRLLAQNRARSIRDFLVNQQNIAEERVFLVEADLTPEPVDDTVPTNLTLTAK